MSHARGGRRNQAALRAPGRANTRVALRTGFSRVAVAAANDKGECAWWLCVCVAPPATGHWPAPLPWLAYKGASAAARLRPPPFPQCHAPRHCCITRESLHQRCITCIKPASPASNLHHLHQAQSGIFLFSWRFGRDGKSFFLTREVFFRVSARNFFFLVFGVFLANLRVSSLHSLKNAPHYTLRLHK